MNDQSSTPASASEKPAPSDTDLLFEPNISINGVIDDNTVSFFLGRLQEVRRAGTDMIVELNTDGGDADAARRIGLVPDLPSDRIVKVGNAALHGAAMVLLSRSRRDELEALVRRVEHVRLETHPHFFEFFVEGCQLEPFGGP